MAHSRLIRFEQTLLGEPDVAADAMSLLSSYLPTKWSSHVCALKIPSLSPRLPLPQIRTCVTPCYIAARSRDPVYLPTLLTANVVKLFQYKDLLLKKRPHRRRVHKFVAATVYPNHKVNPFPTARRKPTLSKTIVSVTRQRHISVLNYW